MISVMQITVSKNTLLGLVLVLLSALAVVNFVQIQSLKRKVESIQVKASSAVSLPLAQASDGDMASHHGGGAATTCGVGGTSCSAASDASQNQELSADEIAAAKKRMDPDGDGTCNTCGMKVDDCITMGMLDCGS